MRKVAVIVSAVLALVFAAPAAASTGLSGWWPFYEGSGSTAHDFSGNHNDGTLFGAAAWTGGYFGPAIAFDGTPGGVRIPNSSAFEPASALSVSAFVKSTSSPGKYVYVISKGGNACLAASYGLFTGAGGGIQFYVSHNDGLSYTLSPDGGTGIWDGQWHFVVGTYDGSTVRLYVDGTQVGTGSSDSSGPIGYNLTGDNNLYVGHYPTCSTLNLEFNGAIDEPTVWTRVLSPYEVSFAYKTLVILHRLVSRLPSFPGG